MHEILIEEKILARNDEIAARNRNALKERGIYSINIVSAPGAGKTSLIERMAGELKNMGLRFAVVEGDLEGDFDSKRIKRHGVPGIPITTGRGGHLAAPPTNTPPPPPSARIEEMTVERLEDTEDYSAFTIRESRAIDGKFVLVSPDVALCNDCLSEMLDPADRRYQYPFINCTNCGPRYSIVLDIPYDRPKTTMAPFIMCADCEREYRDPPNRRFHAEPNACPECGPRAWLHGGGDR